MDYASVEEAKGREGLRLVLTADNPGPWGEAAKALFRLRGVAFLPVRQQAGGDNSALRAWTGQDNAPIAMYQDEAPRSHWLELICLAQRLGSGPSLLPDNMTTRMRMVGLLHEIAGEGGLGWYRRLLIFHPLMQDTELAPLVQRLAARYGYSPEEARKAERRCVEILAALSNELQTSREQGQRYFLGELSALDLYWAAFSNMLQPLPQADCPMSDATRRGYTHLSAPLAAALDPLLLEHRDHLWRDIIGLPMEF